MRALSVSVIVAVLSVCAALGSDVRAMCDGKNPPGRPASRSLKPYTGAPEDLRPFSKFTTPYYEYYQDLVEYNGAARDIPDPDLKDLTRFASDFSLRSTIIPIRCLAIAC